MRKTELEGRLKKVKKSDQKRFTKLSYKLNTILNGDQVKVKFKVIPSLKRKVLTDFLKQFKEATFLMLAGSLLQSAGAAAAKGRAPSVGGSSRVLLFERRP